MLEGQAGFLSALDLCHDASHYDGHDPEAATTPSTSHYDALLL